MGRGYAAVRLQPACRRDGGVEAGPRRVQGRVVGGGRGRGGGGGRGVGRGGGSGGLLRRREERGDGGGDVGGDLPGEQEGGARRELDRENAALQAFHVGGVHGTNAYENGVSTQEP